MDGQCLNHCPRMGSDNRKELRHWQWGSYPSMLKVDLSYPQHLHDAYDDYPLATVLLEIGRDMYSPALQAVFPQTAPQRKLSPNLRDKVRYVVHYRNLKLYLQLSLLVTRIHTMLVFNQSTWLKTYIDFNTHQCSLAGKYFPKGLLYINEQKCFWKDTREFEKTCTCRIDYRRWYLT